MSKPRKGPVCEMCGAVGLPLGFYSANAPSLRLPLASGMMLCPTCAPIAFPPAATPAPRDGQ